MYYAHSTDNQDRSDWQPLPKHLQGVGSEGRPSLPPRRHSLIEAGVDLDFRAGWRAMAGLESIVQAAGRVNREGRHAREDSILTVFTPADEKEQPPPEIRRFAAAMGRLPQELWGDLGAPAALRRYFQEVYWQEGEGLDIIDVEENGRKLQAAPKRTGLLQA